MTASGWGGREGGGREGFAKENEEVFRGDGYVVVLIVVMV